MFTSKKNEEDESEQIKPSHHEGPKEPGSDMDHTREEENERDRKRSWDEHHPNQSH